MKILFVINNLIPGGVTSSLDCLYSNLRDKYNIYVLSLSLEGNLNYLFANALLPSNPLLQYYYQSKQSFHGYKKIIASVVKVVKYATKKCNIDIESKLCHCWTYQISNKYKFDVIISFQDRPTAIFCQYFNTFKIAWIHCDYPTLMGKDKDYIFFEKFNKIICVSSYTAEKFKLTYKTVAPVVAYIYNIIDYERILSLSEQEPTHPNFTDNGFTIISIGRIADYKRMNKIPEIAKKVLTRGWKFKWYILGNGCSEEESLLDETINRYGLKDVVIRLGYLSNPYPYLRKSNLLVSVSATEACPMIFNEARILNVPVVSTDFGSSYEFIKNGVNGLISPIDNIYEAILMLLENKELYEELKNNCRSTIIDNEKIFRDFDMLVSSNNHNADL